MIVPPDHADELSVELAIHCATIAGRGMVTAWRDRGVAFKPKAFAWHNNARWIAWLPFDEPYGPEGEPGLLIGLAAIVHENARQPEAGQ